MKIHVQVPATTANLGPGFDCLALTLDLWNEAEIEPAADFRVEIIGEGSVILPKDEKNLVIRAYLRCLESQGFTRPGGLHIHMTNRIPIGSGLGSSAAAVVMGILAANEIHALRLKIGELIQLAAGLEGHADNAAAALLGGLVVLAQGKEIIYHRFEVPSIQAAVLIPDFHFPTREARAALPQISSYEDAVFNLGRVPLVVTALREGDLINLAEAMDDRLHEPYRAKLIPGAPTALLKARQLGAATALSGAGPGIITFLSQKNEYVMSAIQESFEQEKIKTRVFRISTINQGGYAN